MVSIPQLVPPNTYSNSLQPTLEEVNALSELSKKVDPINASWADDQCLHRFLRATKWDVAKAAARIEDTGKWRREFGPDSILPEHVEKVAEAGRQFLSGFDKDGRPIWYMIPARKSTNQSVDDQIRFVVYTIEKAISLMPENVESLVIIM
jgi:4-nitrophenyl phosphatase